MNADVATLLEPLDEHIQALLRQRLAQSHGLLVLRREVSRGMLLFMPSPGASGISIQDEIMAQLDILLCGLSGACSAQLTDVEDLWSCEQFEQDTAVKVPATLTSYSSHCNNIGQYNEKCRMLYRTHLKVSHQLVTEVRLAACGEADLYTAK